MQRRGNMRAHRLIVRAAPGRSLQSTWPCRPRTAIGQWDVRRTFTEEKLPPDYPHKPKDLPEVKILHPPPEEPTNIMRPNAKVKAAIAAFQDLTFVEFVSFAHEVARILGIPYEQLMAAGAFSGGAPLAGAPAGGAAAGAAPAGAPAQEEKKGPPPKKEIVSADIKLISFPEGAKFNVLKEVRKLKPGMNLMDSKKLVENLPQILAKKVPKEELKEWEAGLKAAGAEFELIEN